jgi:hypothetical protein
MASKRIYLGASPQELAIKRAVAAERRRLLKAIRIHAHWSIRPEALDQTLRFAAAYVRGLEKRMSEGRKRGADR